MSLDITPISEALGAEVRGLDLRRKLAPETVAELVEAGRPAVLVPYRFATDDHQRANAAALADAGAGWMMVEDDFTPAALARRLQELIEQPDRLVGAAAGAAALRRGRAAALLADEVEKLLGAEPTREAAA